MNIENPFENVSELLLSDKSKKDYLCFWKKWRTHCAIIGAEPYPVCPYVLEDFAEDYMPLVKHNTYKFLIKALTAVHKYNHLPRIAFTPRTEDIKKISARRKQTVKQAPILYHEQLMILMDSPKVRARDKALVSMMFDTMLRGFDVRQVEWQDIFTKEVDGAIRGFVKIYRTKGKYIPEGQVRALSSLSMKWLGLYHKRPPNKNYRHSPESKVFPISEKSIAARFVYFSKVLGYKITTHSPRVGATIEMVDKGISEVEIANVAGWNSTAMVKHYARNQAADNSGMTKLFDKLEVEKNMDSSPDFVKNYGSNQNRSERTT